MQDTAKPTLTIRNATPADANALLEMIRELAEYEKILHEVIATPETIQSSFFCENPPAEAFIGEVEGKAVAFAITFHNYSSFLSRRGLYLEDLYVKPECRGMGVGKKILKHLATLAVERGCQRFEWSVLDWNTSAIDFYKSIGAVPMDEWTVYRLAGDALNSFAKQK